MKCRMNMSSFCRLFVFSIALFIVYPNYGSAQSTKHNIIPCPNAISYGNGTFFLNKSTVIIGDSIAAHVFNKWINPITKFKIKQSNHNAQPKINFIKFVLLSDSSEKYSLVIKSNSIFIKGGRSGLTHGLATLVQIVNDSRSKGFKLPCISIDDEPQFAYRGVHLDVSRHFFEKEFIFKYLDALALYKMNTFHWHLTDDQGWRIEIKKYPLLTSLGGYRDGSMVGPHRDQKFDSTRYGGFYSQQDIKDVVLYAQQLGINVIPEIEMPGHATAALFAYPQFACLGSVKEVAKGWGVFDDVFCAKDSTFLFLEDILTEVMTLFPSKYIHVGGDECPKERWRLCPNCQSTMKLNGLKDEHELQSYFIQRIEKFLNQHNRNLIGWDEILEGGLAPNATVMSWRGIDGAIAAAKSNHYAVMTPGTHCYFDHYQGEKNNEPLAIGGYTTLEKVYSFSPIPDSLFENERKFILGAQANLWTEYMYDEKQVEYMLLPRLTALSEVLWTKSEFRNYKNFLSRLNNHFDILSRWNYNYSTSHLRPVLKPKPIPSSNTLEIAVNHDSLINVFVVQTSNNSIAKTFKYSSPFVIDSSCNLLLNFTINNVHYKMNYNFSFSNSTGQNVQLKTTTRGNYANDPFLLVDGRIGDYPWTGNQWLGWYGKDASFSIELLDSMTIDSVVVHCLHDPVSWIHAPKSLTLNNDSLNSIIVHPSQVGALSIHSNFSFKAKNIDVLLSSIGKNPEGFPGANDDGWLFVSEVLVYARPLSNE